MSAATMVYGGYALAEPRHLAADGSEAHQADANRGLHLDPRTSSTYPL